MLDYSVIGVILILAGIAVLILATVVSSRGERRDGTNVKTAGVVMIGPIPIIFGTDTRWLIVAIVLAIILVALALFGSFR